MTLVGWDTARPNLQGMLLARAEFRSKRRRPPLKCRSLEQDVLTSASAAAQLGVQQNVITKLVRTGILATVSADPSLVLLDRSRFDGFCKGNAPAAAYSAALGCSTPYAHRRLAELGVRITHTRNEVGAWLVDRQAADVLTDEVRETSGNHQMTVARSLTDYLRKSNGRYLVSGRHQNDVALITDASRRARARLFLDFDKKRATLRVEGHRKSAPRIKRILEDNI